MYKTIKCNGLFCLSTIQICYMQFGLMYFELSLILLNYQMLILDNSAPLRAYR